MYFVWIPAYKPNITATTVNVFHRKALTGKYILQAAYLTRTMPVTSYKCLDQAAQKLSMWMIISCKRLSIIEADAVFRLGMISPANLQ